MVDGLSPGRPQSFRYQRRSVDDCGPGRGGMAQDGGTRGGTFHGMDRCRENQSWTAASNATRRTTERIAQSERARAGLLVIYS